MTAWTRIHSEVADFYAKLVSKPTAGCCGGKPRCGSAALASEGAS